MRILSSRVVVLLSLVVIFAATSSLGQTETQPSFAGVGVGVKVSLLGVGVETAVPVMQRLNIRGGFNMFSYNRTFNSDGVSYAGQLSFRSAEAHVDWFPFAGAFHLSPGVLIYNGNKITANASVAGGNTFTLNGTTYTSETGNPIQGSGKLDFMTAAPMLTVGWGNLVPRSGKHFSVPFEVGAVFQGAPRVGIGLTGGACDANGANCQNINSDPTFQSNVAAQQAKLNKDVAPFKVYPIISLGFGVRF